MRRRNDLCVPIVATILKAKENRSCTMHYTFFHNTRNPFMQVTINRSRYYYPYSISSGKNLNCNRSKFDVFIVL